MSEPDIWVKPEGEMGKLKKSKIRLRPGCQACGRTTFYEDPSRLCSVEVMSAMISAKCLLNYLPLLQLAV